MPNYVITRKVNEREYYLENIYSDSKVVWITDCARAMTFDHPDKLKAFIAREFPGKDYYSTEYRDADDWGIIAKPKGIWY